CLRRARVRLRFWRPGRLLSVARDRDRAADRLHRSARHRAGLYQCEGLRGIRRPEPPARLQHLAHGAARTCVTALGTAAVDHAPDVHEVVAGEILFDLQWRYAAVSTSSKMPVSLLMPLAVTDPIGLNRKRSLARA